MMANAKQDDSPKQRGLYRNRNRRDEWWIQYWDASGRRRREKGGTKEMAVNLLAKRRLEKLAGTKLPEALRSKALPVSTLLDLASAHVKRHYMTQRSAADGLDSRHPALLAEFGKLDAKRLTPREIERGLDHLAEERKWQPATVNRHKAYLSLAYRIAMADGLVTSNPARLVRQRREDNGRIRWLTADEEATLRVAIRGLWAAHEPEFDLALNTGMRSSEQYSLDWQRNIGLDRRQIALQKTKNKRARYIPLNAEAVAALEKLRKMYGSTGPVIRNGQVKKSRAKGQARKSARNWFEDAVEKAGIQDFTWHDLRHTFASRLVMAGVDLRTVQELMGHRTIQMTARYAHLAPAHQLGAIERLREWDAAACATKVPPATLRGGRKSVQVASAQ